MTANDLVADASALKLASSCCAARFLRNN